MSMIEFTPWDDLENMADEMDRQTLLEYRQRLQIAIHQLELREPDSQSGEAFDQWADEHEELEDLLDEILDRLDELGEE